MGSLSWTSFFGFAPHPLVNDDCSCAMPPMPHQPNVCQAPPPPSGGSDCRAVGCAWPHTKRIAVPGTASPDRDRGRAIPSEFPSGGACATQNTSFDREGSGQLHHMPHRMPHRCRPGQRLRKTVPRPTKPSRATGTGSVGGMGLWHIALLHLPPPP